MHVSVLAACRQRASKPCCVSELCAPPHPAPAVAGGPYKSVLPSVLCPLPGSTLDLFLPDDFEPEDNGNTWPEGSGAAEVRAALKEAARREARQSKKRKVRARHAVQAPPAEQNQWACCLPKGE